MIVDLIIPHLISNKTKILLIILLSIICAILQTILPIIPGYIIDNLVDSLYKPKIYYCLLSLVGITLLNIFFNFFKNYTLIKTESIISNSVLLDVLLKIFDKNYISLKKINSAYLSKRLTEDITFLLKFIFGNLSTMLISIIMFFLAAVYMFYIHITFLLISLVSIPFYIVFLKFMNKIIYNINYKYKENNNNYFSFINEQILLIREIKVNSVYTSSIKIIKNKFNIYYSSVKKSYKINYICDSFISLYNLLINLFFFIVGIHYLKEKIISIGIFTVMIFLHNIVINSITYFFNLSKQYQEFKVCKNRLNDILNIPDERSQGIILSNIDDIEIKNSLWSYSDNKFILYPNINLIKGKIYMIIGENGIGKSTLLDILSGILIKKNGHILINRLYDITAINMKNLRRNLIAFYSQETQFEKMEVGEIFEFMLEKTICLEEIINLIKEVDLDAFFGEELLSKDNWNKYINEFSVGQKKKIMITIQLIKKRGLVFLDEPFTSLDSASVKSLWDWIGKNSNNRIFIIISHDTYMYGNNIEQIEIK